MCGIKYFSKISKASDKTLQISAIPPVSSSTGNNNNNNHNHNHNNNNNNSNSNSNNNNNHNHNHNNNNHNNNNHNNNNNNNNHNNNNKIFYNSPPHLPKLFFPHHHPQSSSVFTSLLEGIISKDSGDFIPRRPC